MKEINYLVILLIQDPIEFYSCYEEGTPSPTFNLILRTSDFFSDESVNYIVKLMLMFSA